MRTILRDNSLSVVMFGLFGLCLLGHSLAGYAAYHDDQQAHQQPSIIVPELAERIFSRGHRGGVVHLAAGARVP
jgi:hypothetical protein